MRSYLVVWTTGSFTDSKDFYEVRESMEDAQALYDKVLDYDDLLVASITEVIESTDYEPLQEPTASEKELENFLGFKSDDFKIGLSLTGQGDDTVVAELPVNLCEVEIGGRVYLFGGISENFYDRMVREYDWRSKEE